MKMMNKYTHNLPTWEKLAKVLIWQQLGDIKGKTILDYGSGQGITANYLARNNNVIAIEPSEKMLENTVCDHPYKQLIGSYEILKIIESESTDIIICHNVLEYADERESIISEFCRILKPNGTLSVVKHNRYGRVMQMAVLLNQFETAHSILDGKNSSASQFGEIRYYDDNDIPAWGSGLCLKERYGLRTFWDLQQNQEIQTDEEWQTNMIEIEKRVSKIPEFYNIAFFHHLIFSKPKTGSY